MTSSRIEHFDIDRIRLTEVGPLDWLGCLARQLTEGRLSPVTTPGTHVVNDHMFILQGYEGSLLKVTNKNGKNTSVSTPHGPHALQNILSPHCSRCEGCERVWSLGIGLYQSTRNEGVTRIQFCLWKHVVQLILLMNRICYDKWVFNGLIDKYASYVWKQHTHVKMSSIKIWLNTDLNLFFTTSNLIGQ